MNIFRPGQIYSEVLVGMKSIQVLSFSVKLNANFMKPLDGTYNLVSAYYLEIEFN